MCLDVCMYFLFFFTFLQFFALIICVQQRQSQTLTLKVDPLCFLLPYSPSSASPFLYSQSLVSFKAFLTVTISLQQKKVLNGCHLCISASLFLPQELIPLILCTACLHPEPKERDQLLHILFNLIKRPDDEQRCEGLFVDKTNTV